jgi:hypothetical protein
MISEQFKKCKLTFVTEYRYRTPKTVFLQNLRFILELLLSLKKTLLERKQRTIACLYYCMK